MYMIITTKKHSYMVDKIDATVEVGSVVFIPENKTWHMITAPGVMTPVVGDEIEEAVKVSTAEALAEALTAGGSVLVEANIDAPTAILIEKDATINLNGKEISVKEDTVGDGVFKVTNGILTIEGEGTINGVGKNDYSMAIWADGGDVIINSGNFINVGAGEHDHYDLIYVKNGGYVEINGGTFECQTPRWTLNSHNTLPGTIVVKGGTFINYNPAESYTDENNEKPSNFVPSGYKVIEESEGVFVVVAE